MIMAKTCNSVCEPLCRCRFPSRRRGVTARFCHADFPFGAVIVREGRLIARGRNLGRTKDDPTAHGEMVAIHRGLAAHGSKALRGATLYTTGEPWAMGV